MWQYISRTTSTNFKTLITLCKNSSDRYHFKLLRNIAITYHIYIDSEYYNLEYGERQGQAYEMEVLEKTMGKWQDHDYFKRCDIFRGP